VDSSRKDLLCKNKYFCINKYMTEPNNTLEKETNISPLLTTTIDPGHTNAVLLPSETTGPVVPLRSAEYPDGVPQ